MQQIKKGSYIVADKIPQKKILVTGMDGYSFTGILMSDYRTPYSKETNQQGTVVVGNISTGYSLCTEKLTPFKQGDIVKGRKHFVLVSKDHNGLSRVFSGTVIARIGDRTLWRPKGYHGNEWVVKDFTIVRYGTPCVFKPGDIVIEKKTGISILKIVVIGPGISSDHFTGMCIKSYNPLNPDNIEGAIANDWISDRFVIYKEPRNVPTPEIKGKWAADKPLPAKKKPTPTLSSVDDGECIDDDNTPYVEPVIDPFVPGATFMHVFKNTTKCVMTGPGKTSTTFSGVILANGYYSDKLRRKFFKLVPSVLFETGTSVKYHNMVIKVSGPGKNPQTFSGVVITGGVLPVGTYSDLWVISEAKEVTNEDI